MIESRGASLSDSGTAGLCLGCSVDNPENVVSNTLGAEADLFVPIGVAGSAFVCVDAGRIVPAGRTAGFAANVNGGLANLLGGATLETYLDGSLQQSRSGGAGLLSVAGVSGGVNAAANFTQPFDEICFRGGSIVGLAANYNVMYGFVLDADADTTSLIATPIEIDANGTSQAVIEVTAIDGLGNPLVAGGDEVTISTTGGTLGDSVTDNGDGTYTTTLTAPTTPGTATVSGTINGQAIDQTATVTFATPSGPGPADAATTWISASPTVIESDGSSTSTITVQARDAQGNNLAIGGDTVALSSTDGSLGSVTDEGDGTYTADLTAPFSDGTAEITGTINGDAIGDSATVEFVSSSDVDASQSTLEADPEQAPANGEALVLITVTARDSGGTPVGAGGDNVELTSTAGTLGSTVVDQGDGTYTATLRAPDSPATAQVSGTINGSPIGETATVGFAVVDASESTISAQPPAIDANGTSRSKIIVQARDGAGDPVSFGGSDVILLTTAGTLANTVDDRGDGTYATWLTSSTSVETATVTGMLDGDMIGGSVDVDFTAPAGPGPADASTTEITASPNVILADGSATSIITVQARDAFGNDLSTGGDSVAIAASAGSLGSITDEGDGSYTATLTAPASTGMAEVTGTINATPIDDTASVEFVESVDVDAGQSTMEAIPDAAPADGVTPVTILVTARDSSGDPLGVGGDDVELGTTAGTLGGTVIDNGDGTYTATLTAPDSGATAEVSGTINGVPIGSIAIVNFLEVDAGQTTIDAHPSAIDANGAARSRITVTARDAAGDPLPFGGHNVTLSTTAGTLASSVTDHGDGTYTTWLTASNDVETATVTGTIDGNAIGGSAAVDFTTPSGPGAADASTTIIFAAPSVIESDGSSTSTVTVQARDAFGNDLGTGGDTVTLAATSGSLGSVTDQGDGSYTAVLTAPSVNGSAELTGMINGNPIDDSATVEFVSSVEVDALMSTLDADPDEAPANGEAVVTITVTARTSGGALLGEGGDEVVLTTTAGSLGATVSDNGDGTYTGSLTAPETPGTAQVSGTINGVPIGDVALVTFLGVDGSETTLSASPSAIDANGTARSKIEVRARDSNGDPLSFGGSNVVLTTTAGSLASSVTDHDDGSYSTWLTSTTTVETAVVTGTIDGQTIGDSVSVDFTTPQGPGGASAATTEISASPTVVEGDGASTSTITVQARDAFGNDLGAGGDSVTLSATAGSLGPVSDQGDGTYTAAWTAPTATGQVEITGTIGGAAIDDSATIRMVESGSDVDASQSTMTADPTSAPANGSAMVTILVEARDSSGLLVGSGGDTVVLETTAGMLGGTVVDNGDGTYVGTLIAPSSPGSAEVTGYINGELIGETVVVSFFGGGIFRDRFEAD